jgi:hypothetical protein
MERQMTDHDKDAHPLPVLRGDWVESRYLSEPKIGRVVNSCWSKDGDTLSCMIDVAIYGYRGDRIGRETPAMGGPRRHEPWVSYSEWFRIEKPDFPLTLEWKSNEDNAGHTLVLVTNAKRLEDRTEHKRDRSRKYVPRAVAKPTNTDFDPELEIRTRRMAAQELRDTYRDTGVSALLTKAEALEAEAYRIAAEAGLERW